MPSASCQKNRSVTILAATKASHPAPHSISNTNHNTTLSPSTTPQHSSFKASQSIARVTLMVMMINIFIITFTYSVLSTSSSYVSSSAHHIRHNCHCNKVKSIMITQQNRLTRSVASHRRRPLQALPLTTDLHCRLLRAARCFHCMSRINLSHRHIAQQCLWHVTFCL
jgi:hypothetical protein